MRTPVTAALVLVHAFVVAPAVAQSSADLASRRVLLEQAQKARADRKHAEALDLAERAGTIKMTASVRRFIAEEQAATGKLAEALGSADQCIVDSNGEPSSSNATEVRAGCIELRDDLKNKVGEVFVDVAKPGLPNLVVKVGDSTLNPALYGAASVVTPGHITVRASADGYTPTTKEVDVAAHAQVHVAIDLSPSAPSTANVVSPPYAPKPPPNPPPPTPAPSERNPVWLVVAGAGIVMVGGGVVASLVSNGKYDDLKTRCTAPTPCDASQAGSDKSSIQTLDTLATVGIVGGVVVAAAGTTLYLAMTREAPTAGAASTTRARVTPTFAAGPRGATFGLHGAF